MSRATRAALAATCLLALPTLAQAHAVLMESNPADGARVERPPAEIRLRFNEPVTPVAIHAIGPGGALILPGPTVASDDALRVPLPPLPVTPAPYTIRYRVTSGDGHPVAGSLLFGVGMTPERPEQTEARGRNLALLAAMAARALHYGSLLAAAGGGLFLALVAPGAAFRTGRDWAPLGRLARLRLTIALAALAVPLNLGLTGALLIGESPLALLTPEAWWAALASTGGTSAAIALSGLALLAVGLWRNRTGIGGTITLLLGALVAVGALTATGHAATAPPAWLAAPLVGLHGLTAAFWLGALGPLRAILRHAPALEAARLVRRFSHGSVWAVALLIVAGVGVSALQISDPDRIGSTAYGQIWLVKMVGVALLLGLATVNRLWLTPALENGARAARERANRLLSLSVTVEIALMALVVLLTAALGTTPPPRALVKPVIEAPVGYSSVATAKGRQAVIGLDPARVGLNRLTLHLAQADGSPFDPKELSVELSQPAAGIEPLSRRPTRTGPGAFALDGLTLPVNGRWELRVDALIDDVDTAVFRASLPLGG
jgi:copper transport protein